MKKLLLFFVVLLPLHFLSAQPKREIRAVWLSTNYRLDWPPEANAASQKVSLQALLNKLQSIHINTIILQVQCRSDVFWESEHQPWSSYLTGTAGQMPDYDPIQFAIDECHKRNMEIHAWLVPFPLGSDATAERYGESHVVSRHPELCLKYGGEWYLDPGLPETTDYLINLYSELVEKYDLDGISLDYTRYPGSKFPDDDSYLQYGNGMERNEWRRQNINRFVHALYDMIQEKKPGMKVGAAPIGAYESLPNASSGFTAYSHVFQDPVEWAASNKLDLAFPQVYWTANYKPQLENWIKKIPNRPIGAGLAAYKMEPAPDGENWPSSTLTNQIDQARELGAQGICFFRTKHITSNSKSILDLLKKGQFKYPAHIPPMEWYGVTHPGTPQNVTITHKEGNTYTISWDTPDSETDTPIRYYCLYTGESQEINIDDVKNIACSGIKENQVEYTVPDPSKEYYFTVTAFDKGYYESEPSTVVSTNGGTGFIDRYLPQIEILSYADALLIRSEAEIGSVLLYSVNGMLIGRTECNGREVTIETSGIESGLYIVVIRLTDGTTLKRKMIR